MKSGPLEQYFREKPATVHYAGTIFLQPGQQMDDLLFLQNGFVKVYTLSSSGEAHLITIKGPSEVMPLETLFTAAPNTYFYEALTDVVICRSDKHTFEQAALQDESLNMAIISSTLGTMRTYTQRLQNLEIRGARQRIIYRLLYLVDHFGLQSNNKRQVVALPVSYQDIADALNLTRDTTNRTISVLAKEGLVEKGRRVLIVPDRQRLASAYTG